MVHHFTKQNSIQTSGDAFASAGPDTTLIVDVDAFLISTAGSGGDGADLTGSWTVLINGAVESLNGSGTGLRITNSIASKITIGSAGDVFGRQGMVFGGSGTVVNKGAITGYFQAASCALSGNVSLRNVGLLEGYNFDAVTLGGSGIFSLFNSGIIRAPEGSNSISALSNVESHLTNIGTVIGNVALGALNDTFINFKKVGGIIKNGIVNGVIDLGAGDDLFKGGAKAETLRDNSGTDSYSFGGGNDVYLADFAGNDDGLDSINAGKGRDTYDLTGSDALYLVNIGTKPIEGVGLPGQTAVEFFGQTDTIVGFENVVGGPGDDRIWGSDGSNVLSGGLGLDFLYGQGGADRLTGGGDQDTFFFTKLSDSGTKASTRDRITDFLSGFDKIDLSAIDANGNVAGDGVFAFIGVAHFDGTRGQLRVGFVRGDAIVSGDVNGDGKADFSIAINHPFLILESDFVL